MRTKILILSALAGVIGAVSAVAQTNVYSLNAVGYINVTIPTGWSQIANQLNTTNNQIQYLLPNPYIGYPTYQPGFPPSAYDFLTFQKYNGSGFTSINGDSYAYDPTDSQSNGTNYGWDNGTNTLNPGEAAYVHNGSGSNIVVTFVGTVLQGTNQVVVVPGYNMISSVVPQAAGITSVLGLEPAGLQYPTTDFTQFGGGDQVSIYNNGTGGFSSFSEDDYSGNGSTDSSGRSAIPWDTEPVPNVGAGFWYYFNTAAFTQNAPSTLTWTRVFSVNN